jgi:hypothetical protein
VAVLAGRFVLRDPEGLAGASIAEAQASKEAAANGA